MSYQETNPNDPTGDPLTIYDGFNDPDLPAVGDLHPITDIVELGTRRWTWQNDRWSLYGDGEVLGVTFSSEVPIKHNKVFTDDEEENFKVTHFFDMQGLTPLDAPT